MRKYLVAAVLSALILVPSAAHAGFVLDASLGKGYQVTSPRGTEQLNLEIAPGWGPSLPILSMFRLQLGIVLDFADKSGSSTNYALRPMLSIIPPILPLYGRLIVAVNNLREVGGSKREIAYGGAAGVRIGTPSIGLIPSLGIFGELGALPRSRTYVDGDKFTWVLEARAGAYLEF
jgi:hypothetical protein